ncbi:hypothetical protein [Planotetraspora kaengkrachanensis]|uniref:Uncharacterized protein n=1 Tax=Planotetraspora kaengkrachanensis TaxID=575193 RepID=A0A8J3V7J5_9ACTN|nr:hypothetical protein [Planotetraspora kaengkrachanensis]GIG81403.1 hypothetical protein Pka01_45300 [Planotetraspora kaengkrachanensis]
MILMLEWRVDYPDYAGGGKPVPRRWPNRNIPRSPQQFSEMLEGNLPQEGLQRQWLGGHRYCAVERQVITLIPMVQMYLRPTAAVRLAVEPQLASWDRIGHPSQLRLARFLTHVDAIARPMMTTTNSRLAVELVVGSADGASLTTGGRDLDNYLFPIAQHLGATRLAAVFGRKVYGPSSFAVGPALPSSIVRPPRFATRMVGSYSRKEWKQNLRDRLLQAGVGRAAPGPLAMDIAVITGPGRNWANVWKPLIDSLGPIVGEDPWKPFHPNDDRIVSLGLHHEVDGGVRHDVIIEIRWANL